MVFTPQLSPLSNVSEEDAWRMMMSLGFDISAAEVPVLVRDSVSGLLVAAGPDGPSFIEVLAGQAPGQLASCPASQAARSLCRMVSHFALADRYADDASKLRRTLSDALVFRPFLYDDQLTQALPVSLLDQVADYLDNAVARFEADRKDREAASSFVLAASSMLVRLCDTDPSTRAFDELHLVSREDLAWSSALASLADRMIDASPSWDVARFESELAATVRKWGSALEPDAVPVLEIPHAVLAAQMASKSTTVDAVLAAWDAHVQVASARLAAAAAAEVAGILEVSSSVLVRHVDILGASRLVTPPWSQVLEDLVPTGPSGGLCLLSAPLASLMMAARSDAHLASFDRACQAGWVGLVSASDSQQVLDLTASLLAEPDRSPLDRVGPALDAARDTLARQAACPPSRKAGVRSSSGSKPFLAP